MFSSVIIQDIFHMPEEIPTKTQKVPVTHRPHQSLSLWKEHRASLAMKIVATHRTALVNLPLSSHNTGVVNR